jgi:hypothetical protein
MSLKAFHLVFVTVTTMLSFVVAGWAVMQFLDTRHAGYLAAAAGALACGAAMVYYGKVFLKKFKDIGYL